MKPFNPHRQSQQLRRFKPTRKPAGIFCVSVAFSDAALLVLAFFLAVSPFIMQPGINIKLPASPFTGGAQFGSMVLSITRGGWFYFNDERLDASRLAEALERAAGAAVDDADRARELGGQHLLQIARRGGHERRTYEMLRKPQRPVD